MKTGSRIIIGLMFVLAGLLLSSDRIISYFRSEPILLSNNFQKVDSRVLSANSDSVNVETYDPVHLDISNIGLSINVGPGYYDSTSQTWTLSDTEASFMTVSAKPNSISGNTYIYGHNITAVFAKLNNLKNGDEAVITDQAGNMFKYIMSSQTDVDPRDVSMLDYNGAPILTLQTCSGVFDQTRRLFIFNLIGEN